MISSIGSMNVNQHTSAQSQKAGKNKENKEYGWMKEKKGNAYGFKAHNKHYLNFQEQLKALESAQQATATAQTQATAGTADTTATSSPVKTATTTAATTPADIDALLPAEEDSTKGLDIAA